MSTKSDNFNDTEPGSIEIYRRGEIDITIEEN